MEPSRSLVTRIINVSIVKHRRIQKDQLWIQVLNWLLVVYLEQDGKIIDPFSLFFKQKRQADITIDGEGLLIAPGYIDIQINGTTLQDEY
jgi:N-acetylglucosamine-6-phosphate deacetylase